jgi:hypothetical protein
MIASVFKVPWMITALLKRTLSPREETDKCFPEALT